MWQGIVEGCVFGIDMWYGYTALQDMFLNWFLTAEDNNALLYSYLDPKGDGGSIHDILGLLGLS